MGLGLNILPFSFFLFASQGLFAAQTIEQTVKVNINGNAHTSNHIWIIDKEKFELKVLANNSERRYIFNGKVMYVCGRLDASQENIMKDLNISEKAMFKKYQKGVCQEVPSNFLVRFFLSPVAAIETIDLSDGLKLTLEIDSFKLSATQDKKIANIDAKGFSRSYTLIRSGSLGKTVYSFQESFFNSIQFEPRKNLWTEISKNLMRQPNGRTLLRELRKDRDQITGFILESETIIEATLANGSKSSGTISVKTQKSGLTSISKAHFQIPQNYELFSAESLKLSAQFAAPKTENEPEKKAEEDLSLIDKVQSVFFCAIAGAFACISR